MVWIHTIFVQIFMVLFFITSGEIKMLFLGLEIGVVIGQILFVLDKTMER